MKDNTIVDQIKQRIDEYLIGKGINVSKPFRCLNPDHMDKHPSMSYDKARNKAHCFSCSASYDIFDLIGIDYGLSDFKDQLQRAKELYHMDDSGLRGSGKPIKNGTTKAGSPPRVATPTSGLGSAEVGTAASAYIEKAHQSVGRTNYFESRGISQKVIEEYRLGYDPEVNAVVIPMSADYYIQRKALKERGKVDQPYKNMHGTPIELFNLKALESSEPVFIVEGAFDALSVIEAGGQAIAMNGVANTDRLVRRIQKLSASPAIIISLDNDNAGKGASEKLLASLVEIDVAAVVVNISGGHKDPNEALLADRDEFVRAVRETAEKVKQCAQEAKDAERITYVEQTSVIAHLDNFLGQIKDSVNTPAIPTGFCGFDNVLDDGLYEGLYILGALSSLGKTTIVLQIADQIAQGGHDVLIFSLEMARSELMAKSISRITYQESRGAAGNGVTENASILAKTVRGITAGKKHRFYSDDEKRHINHCVKKYADYASRLFIYEGMGDINALRVREIIQKHIRATGTPPVVVVDYLQILAPHDPRCSDKQNTDFAVLELKRASRDFKIPVIAISSLNRQSYSAAISMGSFKESGAIEYSADVLMGLQFEGAGNLDDEQLSKRKEENPRKIELKIIKNRNGAASGSILFDYHQSYNCFVERDVAKPDSAGPKRRR